MSQRLGAHSETEKIARLARRQGWMVEITRGNHVRFTSPSGDIIIASLTGGASSHVQFRRRLTKAGLEMQHRSGKGRVPRDGASR